MPHLEVEHNYQPLAASLFSALSTIQMTEVLPKKSCPDVILLYERLNNTRCAILLTFHHFL